MPRTWLDDVLGSESPTPEFVADLRDRLTDAWKRADAETPAAPGARPWTPIVAGVAGIVLLFGALALLGREDDGDAALDPVPYEGEVDHAQDVSNADARRAVSLALSDGAIRMGDDITAVYVEHDRGASYRVIIRGEVTRMPSDVCTIGRDPGVVTGAVFLVPALLNRVAARSPEWDMTTSCLGETSAVPGQSGED